MHEVSIAFSLLDIVEKICQEEGFSSVESVRVRVGSASGILPAAFAFAFDAVKKGSLASDAKIIIDVVPLGGFCNGCQSHFEMEGAFVLECPICASHSFRVDKGHELQIVEMEVN